MSSMDQPVPPILAAPRRPKEKISLLQFVRAMRDNWLGTYSEQDFERDIVLW